MKLNLLSFTIVSSLFLSSHAHSGSLADALKKILGDVSSKAEAMQLSNDLTLEPAGTTYWKNYNVNENVFCDWNVTRELTSANDYNIDYNNFFTYLIKPRNRPYATHASWIGLVLYSPTNTTEMVVLNTSEYTELNAPHIVCKNKGFTPKTPFPSDLNVRLNGLVFDQADNSVDTNPEIAIESFVTFDAVDRGPLFKSQLEFIRNSNYDISVNVNYMSNETGEWTELSDVNWGLKTVSQTYRLPNGRAPSIPGGIRDKSIEADITYSNKTIKFERLSVQGELPYPTIMRIEYELSNPDGKTDVFVKDFQLSTEECFVNLGAETGDDYCL